MRQLSILRGESGEQKLIISGDTWPSTVVMLSSGSAGFLKAPINELVRGTPWNHQRSCSATLEDLAHAFRRKVDDFIARLRGYKARRLNRYEATIRKVHAESISKATTFLAKLDAALLNNEMSLAELERRP
ncbi:hypothetical protein [Vitiosangium sp. GDMCC 1.1324]|uniref:hypothetical protein n=1 Tax=Vitiosangium sp. (strain GDMCC 1.1324) TaxID=2138576 RepID=UPI000D3C2EF3|nr:hypothetical protein [Vitiosangium sp. GDMCC 1.1324]PTL75327.1 hypothetical protein DAT35_55105 [Vitiosangium sp. GDMCC 1.1324]